MFGKQTDEGAHCHFFMIIVSMKIHSFRYIAEDAFHVIDSYELVEVNWICITRYIGLSHPTLLSKTLLAATTIVNCMTMVRESLKDYCKHGGLSLM